MRVPSEELGDFRLADILSLLAVRRLSSIASAARELKVTPSQISKSITRLENQLKIVVLARSGRGVLMTDEGERAVHHLENVIAHWRQARQLSSEAPHPLIIAAPSYMNMVFLPLILACRPQVRLRNLEMPPPLIRAFIGQNLFDLTLMLGKPTLPESWTCTLVGELRKGLFANPKLAQKLSDHPLSDRDLCELPFISPISGFNGHSVQLDDGCPLKYANRRLGHEVTTLVLALELAACTEQLVFGPVIAAQRYLASGELVEIKVEGWHVCEPLYLVCSSDRVLATDQRLIATALSTALVESRDADAER